MIPKMQVCWFEALFMLAKIGLVTLILAVVGGVGFLIWFCINHVRIV